jgi:hypothetical protein
VSKGKYEISGKDPKSLITQIMTDYTDVRHNEAKEKSVQSFFEISVIKRGLFL